MTDPLKTLLNRSWARFCILLVVVVCRVSFAPWTHIEYGAANNDSFHTNHPPLNRFQPLLMQVQTLVEESKEGGIIYLNDLSDTWQQEQALNHSAQALSAFIESQKEKGGPLASAWSQITIRLLPGDFRTMTLPYTDSAGLRNPYRKFFLETPEAVLDRMIEHTDRLELETYFQSDAEPILSSSRWNISSPVRAWPYVRPEGEMDPAPVMKYVFTAKKKISRPRSSRPKGSIFVPQKGSGQTLFLHCRDALAKIGQLRSLSLDELYDRATFPRRERIPLF